MIPLALPNWARVLSLSVILFLLAATISRVTSYRDPGSVFFDLDRAYEKYYSNHREAEGHAFKQEAIDWFQRIAAEGAQDGHNDGTAVVDGELPPPGLVKAGATPRICAAFLTAARQSEGEQYVELSVATALANMTIEERADLDLAIYFVNTDPTIHPSYNSWVQQAADHVWSARDVTNQTILDALHRLEIAKDFHSKAGIDYSLALQRCYEQTTAPYIAIFEGDVIFADGWLARSLLALEHLRDYIGEAADTSRWLYMRIFNEERSTGFESRSIFGNGIPIIVPSVSLLLTCGLLSTRHILRRKGTRGFLDIPTILVLSWITVPAFIVLFFQSGKATVLPPAPGVRIERFGCCTQGLIFPREQAPGAWAWLREQAETGPHDVLLNSYYRDTGLDVLAMYPMQLQHVGLTSVINPDRYKDQVVWSVAFEQLKPEALANEHERMVHELYE